VVGLIFFHTAGIFGALPYTVKNDQTSLVLTALAGFFSQWGMPLLFFTAGFATRYSLRGRTPAQLIRERLRRLFIPFIFGLCVVVPPMRYYNLLTNPDYTDSFLRFYPRFFRVVLAPSFPRFIRADPEVGYFETAHLWYLYYLFVFTLVALPLFIFFKSDRGTLVVSRLVKLCDARGAILLMATPVVLIELFVNLGETIGWNRYSFLCFLIWGHLFAADSRFEESAGRDSLIAIVAGCVAVGLFGWVAAVAWREGLDPSHGYEWHSVSWRLLKGCSSWFWVVGVWGLTQRYMRRRAAAGRAAVRGTDGKSGFAGRLLAYANQAVLPFYVLHQTVIVIIGFYVVKWQASVMVKFSVISLASLAATIAVYEVLVKRTPVTRFLFGMKPAGTSTESSG
jgi:Acyltransferase family